MSSPTSTPIPDYTARPLPPAPPVYTGLPPAPPREPAWRARNPTGTGRAPRRVRWAIAGVAVLAMVCWRIDELGIGYTVVGLAALGMIVGTAPDDFRRRNRVYRWVLVVAIVGLLLVPTFRAAEWVVVLSLLTATGAAAFLFGEAFDLRSAELSWVAPVWTPVAGTMWLFRRDKSTSVSRDGTGEPAPRSGAHTLRLAIVVSAVTVILLLVFGALLAGADPNFGKLLSFDLDTSVDLNPTAALFSGFLVAFAVTGCAYLVHTGSIYSKPKPPRPTAVWAWAIPVGAVLVLFVMFLAVQANTLFRGDDFIRDDDGPTYAEYARQGFWQLLTVTVLVIGVMCIAWRFADRQTSVSQLVIRFLLGGLGVATLGIAASAIHRMSLYIGAYGATPERIFPLFVEIYLIVVVVMMLAVGAKFDASWLVRGLVAATAFSMLIFALINPDRLAASINVDHFRDTGKLDIAQLSSLSADAREEIMSLPDAERACVIALMGSGPSESWRGFDIPNHRYRTDDAVTAILDDPTRAGCSTVSSR